MSEIGNKALLRYIDALLRIEDQQGTPAVLETATVQPVIDIGRFITPPNKTPATKKFWAPFIDQTTLAGALTVTHTMAREPGSSAALEMTLGQLYKVLAMQTEIVFPAPPTDLNRIAAEYFLSISTWEAPPILIKIAGGDMGSTPLLVDSDQIYYRFSLGSAMAGSDGTTAAAPAGDSPLPWAGFLWPANQAVDGQGESIGLVATYRYGSVAGAQIVWPTGTQIITRALIQQGDPGLGPYFL